MLRKLFAGLTAPSAGALLRSRLLESRPPAGPTISLPTVVFDLETTGLSPSRGDTLVQIGAVRLERGVEVAGFTTLVHPGRGIPRIATGYHGITDAMVADAPPVREAVAQFGTFCAGALLVAHNAAFDMTVLLMAERAGAPPLRNPAMCSMALARWLDPKEPDVSLDGLCGRMGLVIEGRHQALGDARATAALWVHLLARAAARGVEDCAEITHRARMVEVMSDSAERF